MSEQFSTITAAPSKRKIAFLENKKLRFCAPGFATSIAAINQKSQGTDERGASVDIATIRYASRKSSIRQWRMPFREKSISSMERTYLG